MGVLARRCRASLGAVIEPSNQRFLIVCRGGRTDVTPVWFMRQAGRSLPEYRKLRERHSILDMCSIPEVAAEATLQPVRRLGVDAAILFSDIVVPLRGMGVKLDIRPGIGPVIEEPIRDAAGIDQLRELDPAEGVPFVMEAIRILRSHLDVPLIGFAGAPFTLASYLVEGGPSRTHAFTKALMFGAPEVWAKLMDRLSEATVRYLRAQIEAGAHAVQLFDSWVGHLAPHDYATYVLPSVQRIMGDLGDLDVPRIYFGVGTGELLNPMSRAGADVIGVDWRVPLDAARERVGSAMPVQGNLDPAVCLAPWPVVAERAVDVLRRGGGHTHIFNLGHGVLPETDPQTLTSLVDLVHEWTPDE
jgi:uroporphyrinogen decarboxylase